MTHSKVTLKTLENGSTLTEITTTWTVEIYAKKIVDGQLVPCYQKENRKEMAWEIRTANGRLQFNWDDKNEMLAFFK